MANQAAERFLKNLIALSCRRFKPNTGQVELYQSKLSKWYLTQEQWAAAMSRIAAEYTDEGLPALGVIYGFLKASQDTSHTPGCTALLFRINGFCYALAERDHDGKGLHLKAVDPANLPDLPEGATDIHLVIPQELQDTRHERDYSREVGDLVGAIAG